MSDSTSLTLLTRIQQGDDADAWRQFAAVYDGLILRWLKMNGIGASEADDIRQEVMLVLLREMPNFRHSGRPGAFRSWLRIILANRCKEVFRRRKRQDELVKRRIDDLAAGLANEDSDVSRRWNREHDALLLGQLLEAVADRFSQNSLIAFRRVLLKDEDMETVAADLGMSVNAVRIAKCRVLGALREVAEGLIE